ncbi:hypothetical protein KAR91_44255 [Candidatus Pacearchaeota archaeon]|nr:hypothetical protein [Candidatus Pacearchaeota archaeon]
MTETEIEIPGIGMIKITAKTVSKKIVISIANKTAVNFNVDGELRPPE